MFPWFELVVDKLPLCKVFFFSCVMVSVFLLSIFYIASSALRGEDGIDIYRFLGFILSGHATIASFSGWICLCLRFYLDDYF